MLHVEINTSLVKKSFRYTKRQYFLSATSVSELFHKILYENTAIRWVTLEVYYTDTVTGHGLQANDLQLLNIYWSQTGPQTFETNREWVLSIRRQLHCKEQTLINFNNKWCINSILKFKAVIFRGQMCILLIPAKVWKHKKTTKKIETNKALKCKDLNVEPQCSRSCKPFKKKPQAHE